MIDAPAKKMREWKTLLINKVSLETSVDVPIQNDCINPVSDVPILTEEEIPQQTDHLPLAVKLLDSSDLDDYLNYESVWKNALIAINEDQKDSKNKMMTRKNYPLIALVDDLFQLTAPPVVIYKTTIFPSVPIRISIIGKKYSGKILVARTLAAKYDMAILSMDVLIKEAIAY
jgi:hypothetical protein